MKTENQVFYMISKMLGSCTTRNIKGSQEWNKSMLVIWGQMIDSHHKFQRRNLPHPHNRVAKNPVAGSQSH